MDNCRKQLNFSAVVDADSVALQDLSEESNGPEPESCCICDEEFLNANDLAEHLIKHAEDMLGQNDDNGILYENSGESLSNERSLNQTSSYKSNSSEPEFTTTNFSKINDVEPNGSSNNFRSKSPIVLDIDSDSDEEYLPPGKSAAPPQPPQRLQTIPRGTFRGSRRGRPSYRGIRGVRKL